MIRSLAIRVVLSVFAAAVAAVPVLSQVRETISANALGTGQQLGKTIGVDVRISDYSSDEERAAILEAFKEKGDRGLVNALAKLPSKGRIAITGTLGFDLNFVRVDENSDGDRVIRFVTDRPVSFAERWWSTRSTDYQITLGEIVIRKDGSKSEGTLFPAAKVTLTKDNKIEIRAFRDSWKLANIQYSKRDP